MQNAQNLCHRCSTSLPEGALFCAQCGAPQLVLTETDAQRIADEQAAQTAQAAPAGGAVPLPRLPAMGRIRWRPVIRVAVGIAAALAVVAGAAAAVPAFGFVGELLVLLGPLLALSFYQSRVPGAQMGAGVGARIGAVLGILTGTVLVAVDAGSALVDRYLLRHSAQLDQEMNAAFQQKFAQIMANYATANPDQATAHMQQTMQYYMQFVQSPDGHAAMALAGAAMLCAGVLGYSALFGAFLGWLRPMVSRRRPV